MLQQWRGCTIVELIAGGLSNGLRQRHKCSFYNVDATLLSKHGHDGDDDDDHDYGDDDDGDDGMMLVEVLHNASLHHFFLFPVHFFIWQKSKKC